MLGLASGDRVGDAPGAKFAPLLVVVVVVAAIGQEPVELLMRPSGLDSDRPDGLDERQELGTSLRLPPRQAWRCKAARSR